MTHPPGVSDQQPIQSKRTKKFTLTTKPETQASIPSTVSRSLKPPTNKQSNPHPNTTCSTTTGTVNFAHLSPFYCVSIGLIIRGKPTIGIINAPFLHQTFSALTGKGAWLNETQRLPLLHNPIPPMPANAPKGCIFSCEWGKDRRDVADGNLHRKVESFVNLAAEIGGRGGKGGMVHGVRSLGSATLDLAYCAMGSFDIWWEGVSLFFFSFLSCLLSSQGLA